MALPLSKGELPQVRRRLLFPLFVAAVVAVAAVAEVGSSPPATAGTADVSQSDAVQAKAAAKNSLTAKAVRAAEAFKASLTDSQRATVQYAFSSAKKKTGWSNLPTQFVPRNGVAVKDLNAAQVTKLRTLLRAILSSQGYSDEEGIRKADTYLSQQPNRGSGPIGDNSSTYGAGLYSVAFFGTPSRSKQWTVQFGGHHLAIHMTFSGSTVSNTPYFIGVEPRTAFKVNGKTYAPMADEANALFGAVQSLNASQRSTAKLSQSFDDVLVGPGKDGRFPARQGVTVSSLSPSQRLLVTRAIRSYVSDMPREAANARVAAYRKQYAKTKLAWSGNTDGTTNGSYARIHGPRVWIEIAVQNGIVLSGTHYHSIERDIKTDYGAGT